MRPSVSRSPSPAGAGLHRLRDARPSFSHGPLLAGLCEERSGRRRGKGSGPRKNLSSQGTRQATPRCSRARRAAPPGEGQHPVAGTELRSWLRDAHEGRTYGDRISLDSRSRRKGLAMKKPCASARTSCGRRRRWQRGWSGTCQTSRGGTCAARARGTRRSAEPVTAGMSFVTGSPRSHAVRPGRQRMREQSHADQRDHDARPGRDAA